MEQPTANTRTSADSFKRRFLLLVVAAVSIVFLVMVRHFLVAVLLAAIVGVVRSHRPKLTVTSG